MHKPSGQQLSYPGQIERNTIAPLHLHNQSTSRILDLYLAVPRYPFPSPRILNVHPHSGIYCHHSPLYVSCRQIRNVIFHYHLGIAKLCLHALSALNQKIFKQMAFLNNIILHLWEKFIKCAVSASILLCYDLHHPFPGCLPSCKTNPYLVNNNPSHCHPIALRNQHLNHKQ